MSKILSTLFALGSVLYGLYLYWNKSQYTDGPWWILLILIFAVIVFLLYNLFGGNKDIQKQK